MDKREGLCGVDPTNISVRAIADEIRDRVDEKGVSQVQIYRNSENPDFRLIATAYSDIFFGRILCVGCPLIEECQLPFKK